MMQELLSSATYMCHNFRFLGEKLVIFSFCYNIGTFLLLSHNVQANRLMHEYYYSYLS